MALVLLFILCLILILLKKMQSNFQRCSEKCLIQSESQLTNIWSFLSLPTRIAIKKLRIEFELVFEDNEKQRKIAFNESLFPRGSVYETSEDELFSSDTSCDFSSILAGVNYIAPDIEWYCYVFKDSGFLPFS